MRRLPASTAPSQSAAASDGTSVRGWYIVGVLAIVVLLAQIDRGILSLFVQPMKRDLGLTDTQLSVLLGFAFSFPYIVVGPPLSRIVDRGVRRDLTAASLAVWSVATAICGVAQNFWALFFARALIGSSESANVPAGNSMIADAVPRQRLPLAYAIYNAGGLSGTALSLVIGGVLMGLLAGVRPIMLPGFGVIRNWQLVFMIIGVPGLLVTALVLFTVPEPPRKNASRPGGYPLREVFAFMVAQRSIHLPLMLGVGLMSIQNYGLSAWGPAFFERTYGWGPATVGPLLGMVTLAGSLIGIFAGARLAEWLGRRRDDANLRAMYLAQLLALPLYLIGPLVPNPWVALACWALAGVFGVMGGPGYNAAVQLATPNEMRGQVSILYGIVTNAIGGSLGPTLIALITDYVTPSEADLRYVLFGVRLLLGPLTVYFLWKAVAPYGRALRQVIEAERI